MPNNKREKIPEGTLCVVCADLASGIHYSVASCNGCKTFFRRALVNKQTFQCQFSGDCVVGKSVRCVCRSCRLKKCFDMGMDPKAIQHDRDKIRYTKQLRKEKEAEKERIRLEHENEVKEEVGSPQSATSDNYHNTSTPSSSTAVVNPDTYSLAFEVEAQIEVKNLVAELMILENKMVGVRNAYRFQPHTSATSNIHNRCLFDDDQWVAQNSVPLSTPLPRPCSLESLREWFVRDLSLMMEWGKNLKIMKEKLLVSDKLALMKAFAPVWPLLHLAFYTTEDDEFFSMIKCEPGLQAVPRLNYPDGTYIDCQSEITNSAEMFNLLIDGVYKLLRELKLESHHIVLYKMLLMHNPDAEGLSRPGKKTIEEEREKLLGFLYLCIISERGKGSAILYSNLLMMTATLSRVASFVRRIFDINHIFNRTNDLIDQLIIVGL